MAHIFMFVETVVQTSTTNTKNMLEAEGHTVVIQVDTAATSALNTAWSNAETASGPVDVILVVRGTHQVGGAQPNDMRKFLRDKWVAGIPLMLGGTEAGSSGGTTTHHLINQLGLVPLNGMFVEATTAATADEAVAPRVVADHPTTKGLTVGQTVAMQTGVNFFNTITSDVGQNVVLRVPLDGGGAPGRAFGVYYTEGQDLFVHSQNTLGLTAAPGKAFFCGWLYGNQTAYAPAMGPFTTNVIEWLTSTGPVPLHWDGAALQDAALQGWWDGAAIQGAEPAGWWDGAAIQPLA